MTDPIDEQALDWAVREGIARAGGEPSLHAEVMARVRSNLTRAPKLIMPDFKLRDPSDPPQRIPVETLAAIYAGDLYDWRDWPF